MSQTLEPLIRDLVQWCARAPRSYGEVLDAWRTSCPRLTVWEEAVARGLLETRPGSDGLMVSVTAKGRALCEAALTDLPSQPIAPPLAAIRLPVEAQA